MSTIKLELTVEEVNQILHALGQVPYTQVYTLIHKIQEQAGPQLNPAAAEKGAPNPGINAVDSTDK